MTISVLNLPGDPAFFHADFQQAVLSGLMGGCGLVVFGVLVFCGGRLRRSPVGRLMRRMAVWALLVGILQAALALSPFAGLGAVILPAAWVALLVVLGATARLVMAAPWAQVTQERHWWEAAAEELRASKHRLELARKASPGGWWEWRIPDNELWCDSRFLELFEVADTRSSTESTLRWERLLHPDDVAKVYRELTRHLERSIEVVIDCRFRIAQDQYRWCRLKAVSIQQPDEASFVLAGSIQDIDEFRRNEEQLQRLSEYISKKHRMESLGELTENVAHEFKNVLQAISGQLQFADQHIPDDSEARSDLTMASSLIEQASEISQELLQLSGPAESAAQLVHPNLVLRSLKLILRPMLAADIELCVTPLAREARIKVVPTALQQALLNLCLNARDAMPDGGRLTVSARLIRRKAKGTTMKGARRGRQFVCFSVSDTGPGIPPAVQGRLFEPFYTTKPAGKGTGLGLAIVSDIAKKHHGRVEVSSKKGSGATFKLIVPVAARRSRSAAAVQPAQLVGPADKGNSYAS